MKQGKTKNLVETFLVLFVLFEVIPSAGFALIISGNNVGIGIEAPTQPLDVAGNVRASGNITAATASFSGNVTAGNFSGSGEGLTGLNGSNIIAGTVGSSALALGAVTSGLLGLDSVSPVNVAFYGNVAIVAPGGGDYNNPANAMSNYANWCGTPSATNPCLLKIMPGVYNVGASSVQMQPYIDIEGSGEYTTIIQGNTDSTTAGVVNGANNAEIRFLTVKNMGGVTYAVALYNSSAAPKITHVTAVASGGSFNYGVSNNSSSPAMTNVTATVSGGSGLIISFGVLNSSASSPTMTNVTATASGGAGSYNYGVANASSSPVMMNVIAAASGGFLSVGVNNSSSANSPTMTNVTATASGGDNSYGVYNSPSSSGTVRINHSVIKGATNTISNSAGMTTLVGNTQLDGGAVAGVITCVGAYNASYIALSTSCQ